MSFRQYLAAGVIMLAAVFTFLAVTSPSQKISASQTTLGTPVKKPLTSTPSYNQAPRPAVQPASFERPEITVDESSHPRWVTDIQQSSLRGTQVDRPALTIRPDGYAELKPTVIFYFDYFYSLNGEMSPERIQQLIYDDIFANFPEPAASQLYDLVLRYAEYSHALDSFLESLTQEDVEAQGISKTYLEQNFQNQYFDNEEIDALFNQYDKMLQFTPKTKQLESKIQRYNEASSNEKHAVALELFGEQGAQQLQQLEQAEQQWQQRLQLYDQEKQIILKAGFDQEYQEAQIQALKERMFNQSERVRVRTWERYMQ